jgi:hypothetical protein
MSQAAVAMVAAAGEATVLVYDTYVSNKDRCLQVSSV